MNTTEHPYKKKIERIAYISFGILVIFIGVVVYFVQIEKKKFRDEGIRSDAYVNAEIIRWIFLCLLKAKVRW